MTPIDDGTTQEYRQDDDLPAVETVLLRSESGVVQQYDLPVNEPTADLIAKGGLTPVDADGVVRPHEVVEGRLLLDQVATDGADLGDLVDRLRRVGATDEQLASLTDEWEGIPDPLRRLFADADDRLLAELLAWGHQAEPAGTAGTDSIVEDLAIRLEALGVAEPRLSEALALGSDDAQALFDLNDEDLLALVQEEPAAAETSASTSTPEPVEIPTRGASAERWRTYAVAHGMDTDEADGKSRDELADLYLGPKDT